MTKAFWIRYLKKGVKDRRIGIDLKYCGMPKMAMSVLIGVRVWQQKTIIE